MKTKLFSIFLTFILCSTVFLPISIAQDYTTWNLPEGATKRLGKGWIGEIAYSPDGTQLAVASSIGIWIYNAQTGEELNLFTGHTDRVNSVSFSPDGETLASGSGDGTVLLWNLAPTAPEPTRLASDVNGDGVVNIQDLVLIASNFGATSEILPMSTVMVSSTSKTSSPSQRH